MKSVRACVFAVGITQLVAAAALASQPIPGLFATGVDGSGNALPGNSPDPHYIVVETGQPAMTISSPPGSYVPNSPTSTWIWETASGLPGSVVRTFRISFDLTGLDHTTAQISGTWSTDNGGLNILINGTGTGNTASGFTSFFNFNVNSGFVAGVNTLDFVVVDQGAPGGFRVGAISGTAEIPAPASAALLALTLGAAATRRRR